VTAGGGRDCLVMAKPVGPLCNLRCAYCYYLSKERLFDAERPRRINDDVLERFVAGRLEAAPGPTVHFEWHGGEPTLAGVDFFRRAVEAQRRHARPGVEVTNGLQTNGLLLDDAWAAFLAEHHFSVGLSLDGPADVHDAFRRTAGGAATHREVVRALRSLDKHRVRHDVLCVLHAANVPSPRRVYSYFRDLGVRSLQLLPLVEREPDAPRGVSARTATPEAMGEFLVSAFDLWLAEDLGRVVVQFFDETLRPALGLPHALCVFRETCGDVVVLEHDGGVYACDHFVDEAHRLGSLRERSFAEIVGSPQLTAFGDAKRDALPPECRACDVLPFCHGGCPKDRLAGGRSYLCPAYQRFFRHVRPAMDRLAAHWREGLPIQAFGAVRRAEARQAHAGVGPNDPCPCGSGRKYKKCCRA
jgi:uncharacterized protein